MKLLSKKRKNISLDNKPSNLIAFERFEILLSNEILCDFI